MKRLILLFGVLSNILIFSQTNKSPLLDLQRPFCGFVEEGAVYKDGNEKFREILAQKIRNRKIEGSGTVRTEAIFVVERNGSLSNIKAIGENKSFNIETVRAISKIKSKWKAGTINGEPVKNRIKIPLTMTFYN